MDTTIYNNAVVDILTRHLRTIRSREKRPVFLFSCGGAEPEHPARKQLKDYIDGSYREELHNVICINAESVAKDPAFKGVDLLTQEAMIADISDSLVLFAESVGSFCELGAFSALPHVRPILTVVIEKKHRGDASYLNEGPVEVVKQANCPLSKVFYLKLDCINESEEFMSFINQIRSAVNASEDRPINSKRKNINTDQQRIQVGSFAHELLDIIHLLGPISEKDLIDLYCAIKKFSRTKLRILSQTIESDISESITPNILPSQVLAFMRASNIIGTMMSKNHEATLYYSKVQLDNYFMFKDTNSSEFLNMRAQVLLMKRSRGQLGARNVYRRFD